jgi:hypothetical protein
MIPLTSLPAVPPLSPSGARLALAKRRWVRRDREAGAALFVVSMTIAVLASVGIYALAAAATEVKTSGFERQNTQTHYLASYGTLGTAHEIMATKAQFYMGLMLSTPDQCPGSLPAVPATASILTRACRRLGSPELSTSWTAGVPVTDTYAGTVPYQSGQTPGSFGPTTTQGDFFVELTEPVQAAPPAEYGLNLNFCFIELTVTATGITRPVLATPNYTQTYGSEGVEMQRSRIMAGPVSCPR